MNVLPVETRFLLGEEITEEQQWFLEHYGFLHFEGVARPEEIVRLIAELDSIQDQWLREHRRFVHGIPLFLGRDWEGRPFVQRFAFTTRFSTWMRSFFEDSRFEPVRLLVGKEARIGQDEKDGVVVNRFLNVPGSVHRRLGWHTDGLRDIFALRMPVSQLNVGLHLDHISSDNGGLRLLPGTHKQGFFSTCFRKLYFLYHRPDPAEFAVETRAGDLTVHDGRLWHRVALSSRRGRASLRRAIYVPFITGPFEPKTDQSATPPYHHLGRMIRWFRGLLSAGLLGAVLMSPPAVAEVPGGVAVEEGSLAGTFALKVVTAETVSLPLVGERPAGGLNLLLVHRTWHSGQGRYRQESRLCRVINNEVVGTTILIPDDTTRQLPPSEDEVVVIVHGDGQYRMQGHHQLWGLKGDGPFPDSAEAARLDPRVYDMDKDGHPGITMFSKGWVDGQIYGVQTKSVSLEGAVIGVDHAMGVSRVYKKSWVIGGSNPLVRTDGPSRSPDADPLASWFEEVRLPDGAECADVIVAAESGRLSQRRPF